MTAALSPRLRMMMQRRPTVYEPDDLGQMARILTQLVTQCDACHRNTMHFSRWHLEMRTDREGTHAPWLVAIVRCGHCATEQSEAETLI
jgi:hypothetical protein